MEYIGGSIKGIYRDILRNTDHHVIHDSGWVSNTIVEQGRSLLAAFMKGESNASGVKYMAIGQGIAAWDTNPEAPAQSAIGLVTPYLYHITLGSTEILYLDEQDNVSMTQQIPTRRLQIKATLGPGLPTNETCQLREFGLFGEFGIGKQPFMINSVRHPLIQKMSSDTLERVVHLYF